MTYNETNEGTLCTWHKNIETSLKYYTIFQRQAIGLIYIFCSTINMFFTFILKAFDNQRKEGAASGKRPNFQVLIWPLSMKRFLVQFLKNATSCARVLWFVISGWILERRGPRALTLIITLIPGEGPSSDSDVAPIFTRSDLAIEHILYPANGPFLLKSDSLGPWDTGTSSTLPAGTCSPTYFRLWSHHVQADTPAFK